MGFTTITCFICWRESYAPVILGRKAAKLRKETGNQSLRTKYDTGLSSKEQFTRTISRVIRILAYSPIVLSLAVYMGLSSSYFYLLWTTLTTTYESVYVFSASISGLSYIGVGIGFIAGQLAFSFASDPIAKYMTARKRSAEMKPEYRLAPAILGGILSPAGLFLYGWTVEKQVQWVVPMIGSGIPGFGNSITYVSVSFFAPLCKVLNSAFYR